MTKSVCWVGDSSACVIMSTHPPPPPPLRHCSYAPPPPSPFHQAVIDSIDLYNVISERFFKDSWTIPEVGGGDDGDGTPGDSGDVGAALETTDAPVSSPSSVKDLSLLLGTEFLPMHTVMVDPHPQTVVQQANVLPVLSWSPTNPDDRQLLELLPVLLALTSCQDVRPVLGLRR